MRTVRQDLRPKAQRADNIDPKAAVAGRPCQDRICLQWYPCPATAASNGGSFERSSEGMRNPECVAKHSSIDRPRPGGVVSNTDVNAIETVGCLLHTNSLHPKEKASTLLHGRDMPAASPVCSWRICVMEQTPGARILPPWKIARPPRQPLHTTYSRTAHFCICDCTPPTWPPHTPNCRDGARVRFAQ